VKYLDLQDSVAKATLKAARTELDFRENIAWAKYKTGRMTWECLLDPTNITGGSAGFGDYYVEDGELKAPDKFTMTVDVARNPPLQSRPGSWTLGGYH